MDVNRDGHIDILSGSYSRTRGSMAGLLHVLYGTKDGFRAAQALWGERGTPLILPRNKAFGTDDDAFVDRCCTAAEAADLDGDGHLDLIVGNLRGNFGWFRGKGPGLFEQKATWLMAGDRPLGVAMHSDPCLVDWDRDGDLDLISGALDGSVTFFLNEGSKTAPRFARGVKWLEPARRRGTTVPEGPPPLGDAHLVRPGENTRVEAADVDGDGLLDLLVGDQVTLHRPAAGIDPSSIMELWHAWNAKHTDLAALESEPAKWQKAYAALEAERASFLQSEETGFVWLLRQRSADR